MPDNKIIVIATTDIIPPYLMMRLVDRRSLDYMELRDSIQAHGILNSILVRQSSRFPGKYEIIDGMYRFSCAKDLQLEQIPCILVTAVDEEALIMQIEANMQRPPTKRSEFATHLKRLFAANPDLTFEALSVRLNKNPGWIRSVLKLNRLSEATKRELDAGNLSLVAAYAMSRLPQRIQDDFLPKAICMGGREAAAYCNAMMKEYVEHIFQGRAEKYYTNIDKPRPFLRSFRSILNEFEHSLCGPVFLAELDNPTDLDIWKLALAWVLHLDPDAIKDFEERRKTNMQFLESQIIERRKKRATLKSQKEADLSDDWRYPLIDDK